MENENNRIKVLSENDAVELLERAYYGCKAKIENVKVEYDNLGADTVPCDCSQGSRKVTFDLLHDGIIDSLAIVSKKWTEEDEGDYGEYIGTSTYFDCVLQGKAGIIAEIRRKEEDFHNAMPPLLYGFSMSIQHEELNNEEQSILTRMHGEDNVCSSCQKQFVFDAKKHPYYSSLQPAEGGITGGIIVYCSQECYEQEFPAMREQELLNEEVEG